MTTSEPSQHSIARKPLPPSTPGIEDASPVSPLLEPNLARISPVEAEPSLLPQQLQAQEHQRPAATNGHGAADSSSADIYPARSEPAQYPQVLEYRHHAGHGEEAAGQASWGEDQAGWREDHATAQAQAQEAKPQANPPVAVRRSCCDLCRRSQWPTEPKTLPSRLGRLWYAKTEVLFVLIACGFLAVGTLIIILNGQQQSKLGDGVVQTALVIPSVWPLLFSAIVGGMLKVIAHRSLQRGSSLGTLEQLMGSQTVFGAVKSVWVLRSLSLPFVLVSLTLLALWSLSPIGSQASLRVLYLDTVFENQTVAISYMTTDPIRWAQQNYPPPLSNGAFTGVQGIYQSVFTGALLSQGSSLQCLNKTLQQNDFDRLVSLVGGASSAVDKSTSDAWGNFRLPTYHLLLEDDAAAWSDNTWLAVPTEELPPYTAGTGVPLRNLPDTGVGNLTFSIPASYYKFECDKWETKVPDDEQARFQFPPPTGSSQLAVPAGEFQTTLLFNTSTWADPGPNGTSCTIPNRPIFYRIENIHSISCLLSTEYIETMVRCSRNEPSSLISCRAQAVRGSPDRGTLCPQITELDFANLSYFDELNYMNKILALSRDLYYPSPAESYLLNPANVAAGAELQMLQIASAVPPDVFGKRLGFVFNTWSMVYRGPSRILGGDGNDDGSGFVREFMENTTATWTVDAGQIYRVNSAWLTAYMLSAIVLWVCSVATLIVQASQLMPLQLLGSVSTLTRDSPYFDNQVSTAGSALGGDKRARLLRSRRIRFLDVNGSAAVGRLAIASEGPTSSHRPAERNRMYE